MKIKKYILAVATIFLPLLLAGITSPFIMTNRYKSLVRPPLSPPGWGFPIVWSILYLLMGISYYMVKNNTTDDKIKWYYYLGLIVNLLWSFIFFNGRLFLLGAIWIVLIIALLINLITKYYKIKKIAAYLQLPYLFWLIFALYLSIGILLLN